MTLQFTSARAIANWMDHKEFPLIKCYRGEIPNYSKIQFLNDLKELPQHILNKKFDSEWNGISFSRCLKGLKGLSAILEVQKILAALTSKMARSKEVLDAQGIGNALYGLQKMDAITEAVQALLQVLADKMAQSKDVLRAQGIGMALYGLQNMDASTEAVQALLRVLADKIARSKEVLSAQHIAMAK